MGGLFFALLIANIFLIVYYRLTIAHHARVASSPERVNLFLVLSFPSRAGLDAEGMKYWRRYWGAVAVMLLIFAAGLWWRYPVISAQLRTAS